MSFVPQVITGASADGDYVYYNATVVNNSVTLDQRKDDPELVFQDTRQKPIVKDSSKYCVSVDSFTLNGPQKNFPLYIPQIVPGTDIDLTIYSITFGVYLQNTSGGTPDPTGGVQSGTWVQATIPITWIPENYLSRTAPVPTTAFPRQQETPYYYGYSYDHFVNILNNALTAAWRDVIFQTTQISAYGGGGGPTYPGANTKCPFFEFNPETGLFALCQDAQTSFLPFGTVARTASQVYNANQGVSDQLAPFTPFGPSTTANYITGEFSYVGMNGNLEGLLSNFDTFYYGFRNGSIRDGTTGAFATGYSYTETTSQAIAPSAVTWSGPGLVLLPEFFFNTVPVPSRPGSIFVLPPPYSDPTNAVTPTYIRDIQNSISTGTLWSPIASLVLVTSTLPVRFENNASPVELGQGNVGGTTQTSGATQKVLLETPMNCLTADMWRGFLDYKPLVPLFSSLDPVQDGITAVDVRVCWRSRLTNSLIPVKMYNSSNFTIRLRFVKKA
jgi:hypothetical protein